MTIPESLRPTVLLLALCAFPISLEGQAADGGSFQILLEGRPAGSEEFTIRQTGSGSTTEIAAAGQVEMRLQTGTLTLTSRLNARGLEASPVTYRVDVGGDSPRRIAGTVATGRFSARVGTPSGERLSEFVASNGAIILDEGIAHHYYFLAQRLRNGRVPVIIPRENRQVMATVADGGAERVEVAGESANLFRLVVTPDGGSPRHVWVDGLGRVIVVEIPSLGYRAVRTTLPR